ncbi:hypothetical protein J4Q44_G00053180 [Coregonus suidteri]|uniref:Reelin domain-containing protein n=1 Tax=Coregonus suidteri TaxID=861788 RepID=A0AAN8M580_9TELE
MCGPVRGAGSLVEREFISHQSVNQEQSTTEVTMSISLLFPLWVAVSFSLIRPTLGFSRGASPASCLEMSPGHIRPQPQDLHHSHVTLYTSASIYLPGDTVTVTVRSTRDFMGFLLQARSLGAAGGRGRGGKVAGTWTLTPPGTHTLRCLSDNDSLTHSDKQLKRNLSFVWRAPDTALGDIRFYNRGFPGWENATVVDVGSSPSELQEEVTTLTSSPELSPSPSPVSLSLGKETDGGRKDEEMTDGGRKDEEMTDGGMEKEGVKLPETTLGLTSSPQPLSADPTQIFTTTRPQTQYLPNPEPLTRPQSWTSSEPMPPPPNLKQPLETQSQTLFNPLPHVKGGSIPQNRSIGHHTHPNPNPKTKTQPGAPESEGKIPDIVPSQSAWELGTLLGCAAGLGMILAIGFRYLCSQYCSKRTGVTLNDRERDYDRDRNHGGMIHIQECSDLVRVRRIRENSFVLLAEYNLLTPPGN